MKASVATQNEFVEVDMGLPRPELQIQVLWYAPHGERGLLGLGVDEDCTHTKELSVREIWQSKLRDGAHSLEIYAEGRAAVLTQRQEVLAERDIVSQLQEHLAETQAQVDDWNFWYDQEYGSEYEMVQEDQEEEGEIAKVNQAQPLVPAAGQEQSPPVTPPVLQHVPAELLPPRQTPSFIAPLPRVQPNTRQQPPPPPPPLEPPPRESTQTP